MGLLDQFSNMSDDQSQGLLSAGLRMMAASGPSRDPIGFGQIANYGLQGYQSNMDAARKRKLEEDQAKQAMLLRGLQIQEAQGGLQDHQAARGQRQAIEAAARDSMFTPGMQAGSLPGGPTPENAAQIPNMRGGMDVDGLVQRVMAINPMEGLKLKQQFAKTRELKETTNEIVDGKVAKVNWFKDGSHEVVGGMQPRDKMEVLNLGDRKEAYNPYALQPGQKLQMGVDPSTVYTGSIAIRGQNMNDGRARDLNAITQAGKVATTSTGLRSEFDGLAEVKNYKQALPAFNAIVDASQRNTPQSDINLVYGIAKLYDPNSVVREGEYATVANSPNIPDRLKGQIQYLQGGGKLTPKVKQELLAEASGRMKSFEDPYVSARSNYGDIATRSGGDASLLFPSEYKSPIQPQKPTAPQGAMSTKPIANASNKGRTIIEHETGKRYRSNGLQWTEVN